MRFIHVLALAAGSLLAMSSSCKKEDDAHPCAGSIVVETSQLPGVKPTITEPIPNAGQSNYYVVNSAADYQELFASPPPPALHFATHTLLAGKTRLATNGHVLAQEVAQTCAGYTYTVRLETGEHPVVTNLTYYVLVPKIANGAKVVFEAQPRPPAASEGRASASELER